MLKVEIPFPDKWVHVLNNLIQMKYPSGGLTSQKEREELLLNMFEVMYDKRMFGINFKKWAEDVDCAYCEAKLKGELQ